MSYGARGDRVGRAAQRLGAGGAGVLDPGRGDARQAQRLRQRPGGLADVVLLEADAEPGGLDLPGRDAGIGQRLVERLEHQLVGAAVPALAEARAAHAEDGDLVADAAGHYVLTPSLPGARAAALRRRLPEIAAKAAVAVEVLDPVDHAQRQADRELVGVGIGELHQHAAAAFEVDVAELERRARRVGEEVAGVREHARRHVGEAGRRLRRPAPGTPD